MTIINNIVYDQKGFTIIRCKNIIHIVDRQFNEDYWSATIEAIDSDGKPYVIAPANLCNINRYQINWKKLKHILKCAGFKGLSRHNLKCDFYTREPNSYGSGHRTHYVWKNPKYHTPIVKE